MRRIILIVGIAFLTSALVSCQARSRPEPVPSGSEKPKAPREPATPAKDETKDNHESPWDSIGLRVETGRFGVTVTEVRKNSPAAEAGIMEGDYIDKIGDSHVNTTAGVNAAIRSRNAGEQMVITRSTKDGESDRFWADTS